MLNSRAIKGYSINTKECLYLVPLSIFGILLGYMYFAFNKLVKKGSKKLQKYTITSAIICGLILGIIGSLLPLTMFSGEEDIAQISKAYQEIGFITLALIAILKLFLTNTCITLGFKGGHFFPCIFAGIAFGYALAIPIGINEVFGYRL